MPPRAGRLGPPLRRAARCRQVERSGASARPECRAARARAQLVTPPPQDLAYSSLNFTGGPGRPAARGGAAPQAGARQYLPAGQRFRIARNAVDWLGWRFQARAPRPAPGGAPAVPRTPREAGLDRQQRRRTRAQVGSRPASGLRLWDVRFGGERIVYELALQEALVSASGATPSQARVGAPGRSRSARARAKAACKPDPDHPPGVRGGAVQPRFGMQRCRPVRRRAEHPSQGA